MPDLKFRIKNLIVFLFFLHVSGNVFAQIGLPPVNHPRKAAQRNEIDAKRTDSDINSKDALPRSREFKRIDSTYYIGWMYEGIYKAEHAADYAGYKNASVPLQRALDLLERDYAKELKTRSADFMIYIPVYRFHIDYSLIAYQLVDCYNNIDLPEEAVKTIRRALKFNFQREFYFQAYNALSWTIHRNRFYTSSKYSFLKNSIEENEAMANAVLDSALNKIRRDSRLNSQLFQPGYEESERQSVYHYKAMLYSYALNLDSASKYYNLMKNYPFFSNNNYATFLSISGDFRQAANYYNRARSQDMGDRRLQEWAYYGSILDIYKGNPEKAALDMKDMIQAVGSTPGFGWYNIALARSMYYHGDIKEADRYIQKAEEFKEVHIGTTLGQSHYDFSVNLVKMMNNVGKVQQIKFENKNWWYNPSVLAKIAKQSLEQLMLQYFIVNQFALNPERELVIYKLFSTESTVTWDEIWYLIRDFSTQFFHRKFEEQMKEDKRVGVHKYFKLNTARLLMKKGDYKQAKEMLEEILEDRSLDPEFEKLLIARTYESLVACTDKLKDKTSNARYVNYFFNAYPQLIPFSDIQANMRLNILGTPDESVMEQLRNCNINWVKDNHTLAPEATIRFEQSGKNTTITYYVTGHNGQRIVNRQSFVYNKYKNAGVELAYRLFNMKSPLQSEAPNE